MSSDQGREVPPITNRGGTVTSEGGQGSGAGSPDGRVVVWAGVHWLTGTSLRPVAEVLEVVKRHLHGLHFEEFEWGRWTYARHARERGTGAMVLWSEGREECAVNLPGEACELLGQVALQSLVRELGLKLTRLDLAWDTDVFTPDVVQAAWNAGAAVTRSKWYDWRENRDGKTFYIGKRGSDPDVRLMRFYDRRGQTRAEIEVHGKRAQLLWGQLDDHDHKHWSQVGLAYVVDFVDFRDRSADANVGRCPRLGWWEDFAEGAKRLYLPIPRKAPTLESQEAWLEGGVSGTLAMVADWSGDPVAYVRKLLAKGRANRSARQRALLDATGVVKRGAR